MAPSSRRAWLAWAGAAAIAPWLAACGDDDATQSDIPATVAWGRATIREALQSSGTKAATIALLHNQRIVWQEAFGVVDQKSGTQATAQTRFNIGSVSKVLAALATMILVDRKLLELDAPVVHYLPQFTMLSAGYKDITIRQLISHASGLPGTYPRNLFASVPLPGYAAELEASLADRHLKHTPGELAVYCNDGFTLMERVILAVTGQSYPDFVQSAILQPLGMNQSGYTLKPLPAGTVAQGHVNDVPQGQEFVMGYATGGLCSTPGDMMKLATLFIQRGQYNGQRILSESGWAEMARDQHRDAPINLTPNWRWGLGWDSVQQPGLDAVGIRALQKNGGTIFFSTDFFVLPQEGMALLISGSGSGFRAGTIAEGILLRALQEIGRLPTLPSPVSNTPPAAVNVSADSVQAVLGTYGNSKSPLQAVSTDGQHIDLLAWDGDVKQWRPLASGLRLRSDDWWWSDAQPTTQFRWQLVGNRRYLLTQSSAGHYRVTIPLGQQMPAAPGPLPPEWAARLNSTWMLSNEAPESAMWATGEVKPVNLRELPELPGYLLWDDSQLLLPESATRAGMTVQVPLDAGRDLVELVAGTTDGRESINAGGWIFLRQS